MAHDGRRIPHIYEIAFAIESEAVNDQDEADCGGERKEKLVASLAEACHDSVAQVALRDEGMRGEEQDQPEDENRKAHELLSRNGCGGGAME
jgi:hypothetical protein